MRRLPRAGLLALLASVLVSPLYFQSGKPGEPALPAPTSPGAVGVVAIDALLPETAGRNEAVLPPPEPFYRRQRMVSLAPAFFQLASAEAQAAVGGRWHFALFPDATFTGRVTRAESVGTGRVNLYGELDGVAGSEFIATLHEGGAAAISLFTPASGRFQIRMTGPGAFAALELAPEQLPPCALPVESAPAAPAQARLEAALHARVAADLNLPGSGYGSFGQQGGSASGLTFTNVDAMIAYTAAAQSGAGGSAGMAALADHMIARANATFINSRVGLRIRLVRLEPVTYTEPNNINTDLTRLAGTSDGFLDALHALRTTVGADLVTLVTETTGGSAAGLAYLYQGFASSSNGFSVVQRAGCESTFVHEIGHNFGCEHDRDNTSGDSNGTSLYPYAYGHRFTPNGYAQLRTVMAYSPGDRIPYFSNPDVSYLGAPTGVAIDQALQAHNAQVLNNTKAALAALRSTAGNQPPTVAFTSPSSARALVARQTVALAATATDPDGAIAAVRFYRLSADDVWDFSNVTSTALSIDTIAPYAINEIEAAAGYVTYAAVAVDNVGAVAADTVAVTINPWYKRETLPLPASYDADVDVTGINTAGQICGTVYDAGGATRACRWTGAAPALLDPLAGDTGSVALGIGEDGAVYGKSVSAGNVARAARWTAGSSAAVDLSTAVSGQTLTAAYGRDASGRTLYALASGRGYRDATATPLNFKSRAIASSGQVGGYDYDFGPGAWRAARWNGSTSTLLAPQATYLSSWGWVINRAGAVAGISSPIVNTWSSTTWRATYWPAGSTSPIDVAPAGSTASTAQGLNDHGEVVGYYGSSFNSPFFWRSGLGSIALEDVVLPAQNVSLDRACAINNVGQIALEGWNGATYVPIRLNPVAGLAHTYWAGAHFSIAELESTGVAGDSDDPDADGRPNLLERAFGLNPRAVETTLGGTGYPILTFDSATQKLTLTFRRLRTPSDIVYTVEASSDLAAGLAGWSSAGAVEVSRDAVDADWEQVVYRSVSSPAPGAPVFLRVRVGR